MANPESLILEQKNTTDLLQELQAGIDVLDPQKGGVEDDRFLKKIDPDTKKTYEILVDDLGAAISEGDPQKKLDAFKEIQRRATVLMDKMDQVVTEEYSVYKAQLESKKNQIDSLNSNIQNVITQEIQDYIQLYDPAKNQGATSITFWNTVLPQLSNLALVEDAYGKALSIKNVDDQITELTKILGDATIILQNLESFSDEYHEVATKMSEDKFVKKIQTTLEVIRNKNDYDKDILDVLPGGNEDEKKWNYSLLQSYSDVFSTPGVQAGSSASILDKIIGGNKVVSLMGSLLIAKKVQSTDGPDAANKQDEFTQKGSADLNLTEKSTAGDVAGVVSANGTGVIQLESIAEYGNELATLAPIYFSLASEHYLTLLVEQDRHNQDTAGKDGLPQHMKSEYDRVAKATPVSGASNFEWAGLDSDGLDDNWGDDVYTFADTNDKKAFLESAIKIMPFLDTLGDRFLENNEPPGMLDKAGNVISIVGEGFTGLEWLTDLIVPDFAEPILQYLMAIRHPFALVFGSVLSAITRGDWKTNFPYNWLILRLFLKGLRMFIRSGPVHLIPKLGPWLESVDKHIEKRLPYKPINVRDAYTRASSREEFIGDVAIEKLKKSEESYARYSALKDIILQRQIGPVTFQYEGRTITLPQIEPKFAKALLAMQDYLVELEYYRQLKNKLRTGDEASKEDQAALGDFKDAAKGDFHLENAAYVQMINNAFILEHGVHQVLVGNTLDTSRLRERGIPRIFRSGDVDYEGTSGTDWNMPKALGDSTVGAFSRGVIHRVPSLGRMMNPALAYHEQFTLSTIFLGRPSDGLAKRFLNYIVENREDIGLTENLTVDDVHHEVAELKKNTSIFNHTDEISLLDHFSHSINGVVEKSVWEYALVRMGFVCRGDGTPNVGEITGLGNLTDTVAHITAHHLTSATDRKKVSDFYEKIKTGATLSPKEILEIGKLTGSRVDLPGSTDGNNHIIGAGRTEMDRFENDYYVADLEDLHDETKFTAAYEKWFYKNAKFCSLGYDIDKHQKKLIAQKKLQDYMKKGGELQEALENGSEHDHIVALEKRMRRLGIDPSTPAFTQIFQGQYDDRVRALATIRTNTETKAVGSLDVDIRNIEKEMKNGSLGDIDEYKKQLAQKLRGVKPEKVAIEFINRALTRTGTDAFTDLEPAVTEYCNFAEARFEARIADIINSMNDTTLSWDSRYSALAEYRQYGESGDEVSDQRGRKIVGATYDAIHAELRTGTPAEQYKKYKAYKLLLNPEEGLDARKRNSKESSFRTERDDIMKKFEKSVMRSIEAIFDNSRYPTFEQLEAEFTQSIDKIEDDYGEDLSHDLIEAAEKRFNAIKKGHEAVIDLCDNITRGARTKQKDIDKDFETIKTMHPEYAKIYLKQASRTIENAKEEYKTKLETEIPSPPPEEPSLAATELEARQENARQLAQKIADAMEGGTTAQDKFNLLQGILTDEQKVVAKNIYEGLRGKGLTSQEMLDALVQDILYAQAGDINTDAQTRHSSMLAHPSLTEINLNLRRAGIRQIETTVNPNLRGGKK